MQKTFVDQMSRRISLQTVPKRIISLVPSQTELLFDLGLDDKIVGLTKFCIHPNEKCKSKTIVGGTKQFRIDVIHQLQPDLIIGNKEENYKEGIEELAKHYPVWMSDITNLDDALDMMTAIGTLTNTTNLAQKLAQSIKLSFSNIQLSKPAQSVLYFIWRKPYMVAGKNTFIDHILNKANLINCVDTSRYPEISTESLQDYKPDYILLSSEPYPFKEKHLEEMKTFFPSAKILLVDGELFSWYGSRLQYTANYLMELFA